MSKLLSKKSFSAPIVIRRFLLSWLLAVTISYSVLPHGLKNLQSLDGLAQMPLPSVLIMTAIFFCAFTVIGQYVNSSSAERWLFAAVFSILATLCLSSCFTWPFLICCGIVLAIFICYGIHGWNDADPETFRTKRESTVSIIIVAAITAIFILFVSIWTVCRVYSFCTPTYDFGIFSQMFYNMRTSGLPLTTVERDGILSHFYVHVSPIYYLLLPFYCLVPVPATLQVLQAIILGSAVIPLWKLCRHKGFSPALRVIVCCLLLVYPAYSGGTSYDIHENAFLSPSILWLFYGVERHNAPLAILSSCLTVLVKEDAAVYVAVIGLYILVKTILRKNEGRTWGLITGMSLFAGAVIWFLFVTNFLSAFGDGVMTGRYRNFMYDGSGSLMSVVKSVIMCPMKALYEAVDSEKLSFISLTLFPLLCLPLFTRRFERYILLIPYFLVNLMPDYQYQHDIFFQYTYGATACLFYMTVVNLSDLDLNWKKIAICLIALICSISCFAKTVIPKAIRYPKYCIDNNTHYAQIREALSQIPDGASVSATTFYTTYLSQRETLYDVKYTSLEHLLSTQYVALAKNETTSYEQFAVNNENGYENLISMLEAQGYELFAQLDQTLVIYKK